MYNNLGKQFGIVIIEVVQYYQDKEGKDYVIIIPYETRNN
jgi:hypothetical protein